MSSVSGSHAPSAVRMNCRRPTVLRSTPAMPPQKRTGSFISNSTRLSPKSSFTIQSRPGDLFSAVSIRRRTGKVAGARREPDYPVVVAVPQLLANEGVLVARNEVGVQLDAVLVLRTGVDAARPALAHLLDEVLAPLAFLPRVVGGQRLALARDELFVEHPLERVLHVRLALGALDLAVAVQPLGDRLEGCPVAQGGLLGALLIRSRYGPVHDLLRGPLLALRRRGHVAPATDRAVSSTRRPQNWASRVGRPRSYSRMPTLSLAPTGAKWKS